MASHGWPWVWASRFHRTTGLLAMARHGWPMVWAWSDQWPKPHGQPWLAIGFWPGSFRGQRACYRLPKAGHGQPCPALRQAMATVSNNDEVARFHQQWKHLITWVALEGHVDENGTCKTADMKTDHTATNLSNTTREMQHPRT